MAFLDDQYLLTGDTASGLFEAIRDLPFIDPHNHADVKEIRDNLNYTDLWQVEAATDHYVWEMLRKRGVSEDYISGSKSPKEKWMKFASVFPDLIGNPTYEWIHLDLKRRFNIDLLINSENAEVIWNLTRERLQNEEMKPQALLNQMKVEVMCSTDDPVDLLEYHQKLSTCLYN